MECIYTHKFSGTCLEKINMIKKLETTALPGLALHRFGTRITFMAALCQPYLEAPSVLLTSLHPLSSIYPNTNAEAKNER